MKKSQTARIRMLAGDASRLLAEVLSLTLAMLDDNHHRRHLFLSNSGQRTASALRTQSEIKNLKSKMFQLI
jgi:hypothetical protein